MKWDLLYKGKKPKNLQRIREIIFKNRRLKSKREIEEYLNPKKIADLSWKDLDIDSKDVKKVIKRLEMAKEKKEKIIIFGDYDADGVCSTAIIWETLYKKGFDCLPYIPDRFSEGYGLKEESLKTLLKQFGKIGLIICVDNGIIAYSAIEKAKKIGIEVVVIDHHRREKRKLKTDYIIYSTKSCGSVLSYFLSREFKTKKENKNNADNTLELACIGVVADQMPLMKINRSIVKYGLVSLNKTKRVGLKEIFNVSGITKTGTYEIGFVIAPRINAAGRLIHAIDALRLLCTRDKKKAEELAKKLNQINFERQKIVDNVLLHAQKNITSEKVIVLSHRSYHEGVIGLAAGKLMEEFYRPAIVISQGKKVSKASARSIAGFDIISIIKDLNHLIIEGGGHPMAAGFTIKTKNIEKFTREINKIADEILTDELLEKKLKIDCEINFNQINFKLYEMLKKNEPFGIDNYPPIFMSKKVELLESKSVGKNSTHLKLKLRQDKTILDAIYFNASSNLLVTKNRRFNLAYQIEENTWQNQKNLQLKVKSIKLD